jgi:hypothetical protein
MLEADWNQMAQVVPFDMQSGENSFKFLHARRHQNIADCSTPLDWDARHSRSRLAPA